MSDGVPSCLAVLTPAVAVLCRTPKSLLYGPASAPTLAMGLLVIMFMIDSLFNGMPDPVYMLAAGGFAGLRSEHLAAVRSPVGMAPRRAQVRAPGNPVAGHSSKGTGNG